MYQDWSKRQKKIYDGLKEIGGEAAGYFESALMYYYDESLLNRVSHLAHDTREIDGGFFIEYLTKFEDENSVRRIGEIFLKVLENSTPTFRQEDIHLIVKRSYELWKKNPQKYGKVKTDANNICVTYGRRGIHFLKDTWAEYNR